MRLILLSLFSLLLVNAIAQQAVTPVQEINGNLAFYVGNVIFEVNPNHGARIESFRVDGNELLYIEHRTGIEDMYGSTAWISPQNLWGWPPQPAIDQNAYTGGISGDKIILTSAVTLTKSGGFNFQIRKIFSADLADTSVTVSYTVINKSSSSRSIASWEIMRVPSGGLSFFPINGTVSGTLAPVFKISGNIAWWKFDPTSNTVEKCFADGKDGWLAHVNDDRVIQIKKFEDTPSNFPSNTEKEVEFYHNPNKIYIEIEKHSGYTSVPAGDSTNLSMKWYLRMLPEGITASQGDAGLLSFVDGIVNPSTVGVKSFSGTQGNYSIYPNPSNGQIRVLGAASGEKMNLKILNILGKTVFDETVSKDEQINLTNFENGIYLYRLESKGKISTGKLILRK